MSAGIDAETQTVVARRQDGRFNGKLAFVTGASSGIGRATALAFAREGASVAAVLWLCSEEAAFTIGQAMVVDGGQTA